MNMHLLYYYWICYLALTVFILQNYDFISKYVRENITDYIMRYSIQFS